MTSTDQSSPIWRIEFLETADKQFSKLDKETCRLINRFIRERLATNEDPKRFGKPLTGNLKEFWRYRIGDYRLICSIQETKLLILVARVSHRKDVYE